jgi:hypothetical protein
VKSEHAKHTQKNYLLSFKLQVVEAIKSGQFGLLMHVINMAYRQDLRLHNGSENMVYLIGIVYLENLCQKYLNNK